MFFKPLSLNYFMKSLIPLFLMVFLLFFGCIFFNNQTNNTTVVNETINQTNNTLINQTNENGSLQNQSNNSSNKSNSGFEFIENVTINASFNESMLNITNNSTNNGDFDFASNISLNTSFVIPHGSIEMLNESQYITISGVNVVLYQVYLLPNNSYLYKFHISHKDNSFMEVPGRFTLKIGDNEPIVFKGRHALLYPHQWYRVRFISNNYADDLQLQFIIYKIIDAKHKTRYKITLNFYTK